MSLVLSVDSFSAALAMGFRRFTRADALRFALTSGVAEGATALLGFFFGKYLLERIAAYDHWVAFALLAGVGLRMMYTGLREARRPLAPSAPDAAFHPPAKVILVSFVTSLDALGVGLGLGVAGKPMFLYSPLIVLSAFASTLAGLYLARRLSQRFGPRCEIFGGLVLLALSFQLLRI